MKLSKSINVAACIAWLAPVLVYFLPPRPWSGCRVLPMRPLGGVNWPNGSARLAISIPGQGEKTGPAGIPGFQAVARRPNQTREAIVRWLQSVPSVMPNHHLTQDEMEDLAQFILSLRTEP